MNDELHILRPLSFGDLFDEAFSLYKKHFVVFFGIILIPSLLDFLITLLFVPELTQMTQAEFEAMSMTRMIELLSSATIPIILSVIVSVIAAAALIKAVANSYLGKQVSIGNSYSYVLPRAVPYILTLLLIGLIVGLASIPVVLFGLVSPVLSLLLGIAYLVFVIIYMFWVAFVSEVIIVEDKYYTSAIGRSRELTKGNWPKILGIFLIYFLIGLIVEWGAGQLIGIVLSGLIQTALLQVFSILLMPVLIIPIVLLYFDSRVRSEGFDLEHLANEMGDDSANAYGN